MAEETAKPDDPFRRQISGLVGTLGGALQAAGKQGARLGIGSVRAAMPLIELYAGTAGKPLDGEPGVSELDPDLTTGFSAARGDDVGAETPQEEPIRFTPREAHVLKLAGRKAALETMEVASVTHPMYAGAPAYVAQSETGTLNPPKIFHLASLIRAGRAYLDDIYDEPQGDEQTVYVPEQTVAYLSVAPGEYAETGPLPSRDIRRLAMRQRSANPPQLAMLRSSSDPASVQPISAASGGISVGTLDPGSIGPGSVGVPVRPVAGPVSVHPGYRGQPARSSGCACGGTSSCTCGCAGGGYEFPPARYNEDGSCGPLWKISCETQWRLRHCFKTAFCETLECMADELCTEKPPGEDPDVGKCLETFVCSLLRCLPAAICPPQTDPCCPAPQAPQHDCHCNFAVGE